jgi:5-formyltetrahydrofolate cyclo-ligase
MQALVSGVVGILGIACRYRDLGNAGVQPIVVPIVDISGQAQQSYRLGLGNGIVPTLVGDHRFGDRYLAAPLSELHDQRKINAPGHIVELEVPIGIGQCGSYRRA